MPIVTKKLSVKWNERNKEHLIAKGYHFTKLGECLEISVKDLLPNSFQTVECRCDFCGKLFRKQFVNIPKDGPINCRNRNCVTERHRYTREKNKMKMIEK